MRRLRLRDDKSLLRETQLGSSKVGSNPWQWNSRALSFNISQTVSMLQEKPDCPAVRQVPVSFWKWEPSVFWKRICFVSIRSVKWRACDVENRVLGTQRYEELDLPISAFRELQYYSGSKAVPGPIKPKQGAEMALGRWDSVLSVLLETSPNEMLT